MSYFYEHRKGWETRLRTLKSYIFQPYLPDLAGTKPILMD